MPVELVKYLAKSFNAWHIGLTLLEGMKESLPSPPPLSSSTDSAPIPAVPDHYVAHPSDALAELYQLLSEVPSK